MLHHQLKMWFRQKLWRKSAHPHPEDTMAVPEIHTGKVHHTEEAAPHHETIHYDNVAIPEVHIPHGRK